MEERNGNNVSSPATPTPAPLQLEAGQQASILQVGGQAFLILAGGQPANTLQALQLNLVPFGNPNAPVLLPVGPQALQVGAVQSAIDQTDGKEPNPSQAERGQHPKTTDPTKTLTLKPSPGGVGSSLTGQGGHIVVAAPSTLQPIAPKAKVQQILAQKDGTPSRVQVGGLPSSLVKVGCVVTTQQSNAPQGHASNSRVRPVHALPGAPSKMVHPGGLQGASPVFPIQSQPFQVHPPTKSQDLRSQSPAAPAPGLSTETANLIRFAAQPFHVAVLQPQLVAMGGNQGQACQENALPAKRNKQSSHQGSPAQANVGCTMTQVKHATTNTAKTNKNIGTQAKILVERKSQAVQFPETGYGEPIHGYLDGTTKLEASGAVGPQGRVIIIRDPEPESASLFFSESSRAVGGDVWKEEESEMWMTDHYEMVHPHFDDVAVYFTEEEWAGISNKGKRLYKKVMMDNYWNLVTVGKIGVTPPVIFKIERGEDPCVCSPQRTDGKLCPDPDSREDPPNASKDHYNIQRFYERLKTITNPIRLAAAGLTVTRIISDASMSEQKEGAISDSTHQCPFQSSLKERPVINETPFRCFKCERCFPRFPNLASHFRAHQKETDLTCPVCSMKFSKVKGLLLHYIKHTGERPFICSGCGKTFTSHIGLNNHLGVNQKKKQYECAQCGKRFSGKYGLLNHERIHDADNPNVCPICGKVFTHKTGLRLHQRVHDKPYICSDCGRCFVRKEECERHMRDHERMQLYDCAECGNAFIYESQLAEHRKVHEPNYDEDGVYPDLVVKVEEDS